VLTAELGAGAACCGAAAGTGDVLAGGVDVAGVTVVLGACAKPTAGIVTSITDNLKQNCFMRSLLLSLASMRRFTLPLPNSFPESFATLDASERMKNNPLPAFGVRFRQQ
jgi:hypothetical protein